MFGVQLYKNNARALLSHILSILNLDWLREVYAECMNIQYLILMRGMKLKHAYKLFVATNEMKVLPVTNTI